MNVRFYIAKLISKIQIPSLRKCKIHSTAKVYEKCELTNVVMGRYSYIGKDSKVTDAEIGEFCSIAGNCQIGGGLHPLNLVSTSPVFLDCKKAVRGFHKFPFKTSERINIGNDVWIGEGCYIKAGVSIGDGAVVGSHAVVTHDVEPYTIVAGIPAKSLQKRFDDDIVAALLKLRWWDWPDDKLAKYSEHFDNPKKFIYAVSEQNWNEVSN